MLVCWLGLARTDPGPIAVIMLQCMQIFAVGPVGALCSPFPLRSVRPPACRRLKHYRFLRPAATVKAVAKALRFVQLLPRQYADARTYNMLVRRGRAEEQLQPSFMLDACMVSRLQALVPGKHRARQPAHNLQASQPSLTGPALLARSCVCVRRLGTCATPCMWPTCCRWSEGCCAQFCLWGGRTMGVRFAGADGTQCSASADACLLTDHCPTAVHCRRLVSRWTRSCTPHSSQVRWLADC